MLGIDNVLKLWENRNNRGCDHIYYEFKSDITVLTKGEVRTSKCMKCGDLKVAEKK